MDEGVGHGCASDQARQDLTRLLQHHRENSEAWTAARHRLQAMCLTRETPCAQRAIKLTNAARVDDWVWMDLPPYRTVHAVHEEEIRRRHEPLVYEEYMIGVSRYLADRADGGQISPEEL